MPDLHTAEHRRLVGAILATVRARLAAELREHHALVERTLSEIAEFDAYVAGGEAPALAGPYVRGMLRDDKPCEAHPDDYAEGCAECREDQAREKVLGELIDGVIGDDYSNLLDAVANPESWLTLEFMADPDRGCMPAYLTSDRVKAEALAAGERYLVEHGGRS